MKTIFTVTLSAIFALALVTGCATDGKQASAKTTQECTVSHGKLLDASGSPMKGCAVMHKGKMMVMGAKLMPMKKNMTMANGMVCMVNGTCVMKDGSKHKMTEGEVMSPAGDIFHAKGLSTPGAWQ